MNELEKNHKENKELIRLASINFYKRTPKQTQRIYELIGFKRSPLTGSEVKHGN